MNNVLIDSDVILDSLLDRQPFTADSAEILSLCENKQINGYVTGLMIANIYYLLRKEHSPKQILETIKQLLTHTSGLPNGLRLLDAVVWLMLRDLKAKKIHPT